MSEQQTQNQPLVKANGQNGSNGKNGKPKNGTPLSESSIYFKVAVPKSIGRRAGRLVPLQVDRTENAQDRIFATLVTETKPPVPYIPTQGTNVAAANCALPN